MKEMERVSPEMRRVGDLLSLYVACHNEKFELSARRLIPIPGIYEPVDYANLCFRLSKIREELATIHVMLKTSNAPMIQTAYVGALLDAVAAIFVICGKLRALKSGELPSKSYDRKIHKSYLDIYFSLVQTYSTLGKRLNSSFRQAG